jgi:hypothetical protein
MEMHHRGISPQSRKGRDPSNSHFVIAKRRFVPMKQSPRGEKRIASLENAPKKLDCHCEANSAEAISA